MPWLPKDWTGKKIGHLTPIERVGTDHRHRALWKCVCDCGKEVVVSPAALSSRIYKGQRPSCGCMHSAHHSKASSKHGLSKTRIYGIWSGMIKRCSPNCHTGATKFYLDRGITVCDRWKNFENFYEDMHEGYADNLTLDRIDSNGNYEPENCRWITLSEQQSNRSSNHLINGMTLKDFAALHGLKQSTLHMRLTKGATLEEAVLPISKFAELKRRKKHESTTP